MKEIEKRFKEIMSDIEVSSTEHDQLLIRQERILEYTKELLSIYRNSEKDSDENTLIMQYLDEIKDNLRQHQFNDVLEFESEQLITEIEKDRGISIETLDLGWNDNFSLLVNYMNEYKHCYFEPPKKNKNGQLIYPKYKGVKLGKWVEEQRKYAMKIMSANINHATRDPIITKLSSIYIKDDMKVKYARNHNRIAIKLISDIYEDKALENLTERNIKLDHPEGQEILTGDRIAGLNDVRFVWTNTDASWMRYFKELKKFYVKNNHCMVETKAVSNGLELGTWVLRQRQEWKKETDVDKARVHKESEDPIIDLCNGEVRILDRDQLLYNLFFTYETNTALAFQNEWTRKDFIELGERLHLTSGGLMLTQEEGNNS